MSDITLQEAKEGLESIGMWMDARYNSRFVGTPIQTWDMPVKEKAFFTVYAMNLVLESDGFDGLLGQNSQDVEVFIQLLRRLGAEKTSEFVRNTLAALRSKSPRDEDRSTEEYYNLFKREEVWSKLAEFLDRRICVSYVLRAQAIQDAGENLFDPKQWQGELPSKKWWQIWK